MEPLSDLVSISFFDVVVVLWLAHPFLRNRSVKRSVLGERCTLGNNVKIVNSVIMDDTTIADGSHIQNCVLCKGVVVGERCALKDCNVGAAWQVGDEEEHRGETLARLA